jgi:hypothetical protein
MYSKQAISVTYTISAAGKCAAGVISIRDMITINRVFLDTYHI